MFCLIGLVLARLLITGVAMVEVESLFPYCYYCHLELDFTITIIIIYIIIKITILIYIISNVTAVPLLMI